MSNSSAKNCALEFAKGDYIVFVEENVRLRSNYLESLYSFAEEKNFEAVMKRNKWYLENGEIMRINGYDYNNVYFNGWLMYKQTQ